MPPELPVACRARAPGTSAAADRCAGSPGEAQRLPVPRSEDGRRGQFARLGAGVWLVEFEQVADFEQGEAQYPRPLDDARAPDDSLWTASLPVDGLVRLHHRPPALAAADRLDVHASLWALFVTPMPLAAFSATRQAAVRDVQNMAFRRCPVTFRRSLEKLRGAGRARIDAEKKTAAVMSDADKGSGSALIKASTDAGYPSAVRKWPTLPRRSNRY